MTTVQITDIRPYQLLCLICRQGCARPDEPYAHAQRLDALQAAMAGNPILPLRARCNTETVYRFQNPGRAEDTPEGALYNDLRDLTILQRLGVVPGTTLPAIDWFLRIPRAIPTARSVCGYPEAEAPGWPRCRLADSGNYERGLALGTGAVIPTRPPEEKQQVKQSSAADCLQARRLRIRPHHLLCISCFHGGRPRDELAPIQEDNLWECIDRMQRQPDIPVELIHGPCMVCPPCSAYHAPTDLCIGGNGMGLRDDKKDLDTLRRLGLRYGDILPASELLARLYAAIGTTTEICGHTDGIERSLDWRICGGPNGNTGYVHARAAGLGVPGVAEE